MSDYSDGLGDLDVEIFKDGFNSLDYMFCRLPRYYNVKILLNEKKHYEEHLKTVKMRLDEKLMSSHKLLIGIIDDIRSIDGCSKMNLSTIKKLKEDTRDARGMLISNGLRMAFLCNKRRRILAVIDTISRMRRFMTVKEEMCEKLKGNDYANAYRLFLKCRNISKDLKSLNCVASIEGPILSQIEELKVRVDREFEMLCRLSKFDGGKYYSILTMQLYVYGGNVASLLRYHEDCFVRCVEYVSRRSIISAILRDDHMCGLEELEFNQISTLCFRLDLSYFPFCVNLMLEQFCNCLYILISMIDWLQEEADDRRSYFKIYRGLSDGLTSFKRVLCKSHVLKYLYMVMSSIRIGKLLFRSFLSIFGSISKFVEIIEEFNGQRAYKMHIKLRNYSNLYFNEFHKSRMRKLRVFLENDNWDPLIIHKGYDIRNFPLIFETVCANASQRFKYRRYATRVFKPVFSNPFSSPQEKEHKRPPEDTTRYFWQETDSELSDGTIDDWEANFNEKRGKNRYSSAVSATQNASPSLMSNSTNQLFIFIGEYLKMISLIDFLTEDVFNCLCALIECYVFFIRFFFSSNLLSNECLNLPFGPRNEFISSWMAESQLQHKFSSIFVHYSNQKILKGDAPKTGLDYMAENPQIQRDFFPNSKDLVTIIQRRVVVFESLMLLKYMLDEIGPCLTNLLGKKYLGTTSFLTPTMPQTVLLPLGERILRYIPLFCMGKDELSEKVLSVKWDTTEEMVKKSAYVDFLIKRFASYLGSLDETVKKFLVPKDLLSQIALQAVIYLMELCIEVFSRIKYISFQGHNLMILDVQEIKSGISKLLNKRDIDWSILDEYVHAYHYPEEIIIKFINENPIYKREQLIGLVNSGPWSQKAKNNIICQTLTPR